MFECDIRKMSIPSAQCCGGCVSRIFQPHNGLRQHLVAGLFRKLTGLETVITIGPAKSWRRNAQVRWHFV
jgi:accessory colonization factor AcfC